MDLHDPNQQLTLVADAQTSVFAIFSAPTNAATPASANVVLTVSPLIPGTPNLTFQAPAVAASSNAISASLSVPVSLIGSVATLSLIPLPPADQQSPPYTSSVVLGPMLAASIPSDSFSINGKLLDAIAMPPTTTFVARAFQGGVQVSNAPLTQQIDGSFQLLLPSAIASAKLTIELTPQSQTDPWFVSNLISLSDPIPGPFMLVAYTMANQFGFVVKDAANNNVSGAVVQAQTTVGTNLLGTTDFAYSGTTDADGTASLSLLPATPLPYNIVVVPPPGSSLATTCPDPVKVLTGSPLGAANPTTVATFNMLQLRPSLFGTVIDGQGNPVANVAITATPGSGPTGSCPSAPAAPGNTTTAVNGSFTLPLDPGTYQLDYDPPAGSAAPRLTEYAVVIGVPAGGADGGVAGGTEMIPHPVPLPVAAAVTGTVVAPDGMTTLASATIRFFQTRGTAADGTPLAPLLRAQTVTDANGAFRVAVPLPN